MSFATQTSYKSFCRIYSLFILCFLKRPSLYYNTSVRHERQKCDTNDTSATRVRHERHEYNTSATRVRHERHECYTNDTGATLVKNFDFDNKTSENIFSHPYNSYIANGEKQKSNFKEESNFILRTSFWKCIVPMPKCV